MKIKNPLMKINNNLISYKEIFWSVKITDRFLEYVRLQNFFENISNVLAQPNFYALLRLKIEVSKLKIK